MTKQHEEFLTLAAGLEDWLTKVKASNPETLDVALYLRGLPLIVSFQLIMLNLLCDQSEAIEELGNLLDGLAGDAEADKLRETLVEDASALVKMFICPCGFVLWANQKANMLKQGFACPGCGAVHDWLLSGGKLHES